MTAKLNLGSVFDYFDVNEAIAVTMLRDQKTGIEYAFVAGRNGRQFGSGIESIDGQGAGSNVGIVRIAPGQAPELVAATRPISMGLTSSLTLSDDNSYLYVANPGVNATFVYDVNEIIKTVEAAKNREQLKSKPLDDINPLVGIATNIGQGGSDKNRPIGAGASWGTTSHAKDPQIITVKPETEYIPEGEEALRKIRFKFGVDPIFSPLEQTYASAKPVVEAIAETIFGEPAQALILQPLPVPLIRPVPLIGPRPLISRPVPTQVGEPIIFPNPVPIIIPDPNLEPNPDPQTEKQTQIDEIEFFLSTFPENEGLIPKDWTPVPLESGKDYNPNRIISAKWSKGKWTWKDSQGIEVTETRSYDEFTLPADRMLTAGQTYYLAMVFKGRKGTEAFTKTFTDVYKVPISQLPTQPPIDTFSSVTILTPGIEIDAQEFASAGLEKIARKIAANGGDVFRYIANTGEWQPVRYFFPTTELDQQQQQADNPKESSKGRPLVLLADWTRDIEQSKLYNSGFAEAAADSFFASLVKLDQELGGSVGGYDNSGKLNRTQGSLLNSPLHFIGYGQGAVVNSEIVQRLGTFFPNAGGSDSSKRDLQVTVIDPIVYGQSSFDPQLRNILDPRITTWQNVTYADTYFQNNAGENPFPTLPQSDWETDLSDFAGFDQNNGTFTPHKTALNWYTGTANLTQGFGTNRYRRLGDLLSSGIEDYEKTWYTPNHTQANLKHGDEDAAWEGIGTGWFTSVLGGGFNYRPYGDTSDKLGQQQLDTAYFERNRTSVSLDNTADPRLGGDYAVPTLFNGNFDAIAFNAGDLQSISGWSLYGGDGGANQITSQAALKKWKTITGLENPANYPDNYALELSSGQSIVHNRFVVPDWGVLRFDLHTGDVTADATNKLRVTFQAADGSIVGVPTEINLQEARGTAGEYLADTRRIGYGERGFETFTLDVPEYLRGKVATVSFVLDGGSPVYLDNVFFKSQHLLLGNPDNARSNPNDVNNYLIEKPQYAVSYNNQTKNPNWVSWRIDKSWIGDSTNSVPRSSLRLTDLPPNYPPNTDYSAKSGSEPWISDPELPITTFPVRVEGADLNNAVSSGSLDRGHLTAFRDRDRNAKDAIATFLTTNLIPQNTENNTLNSAWENFESYLENTLVSKGRELYVIAGGYYNSNQTRFVVNNTIVDSNGDFVLDSNNRIKTGTPNDLSTGESLKGRTNPKQITVPDFTWKIAVVLNPGQQLADISSNTQVIAIITPNKQTPPSGGGSVQLPNQPLPIAASKWSYWPYWRVDVNYLEEITGFDFFSNLPDEIEEAIESDNSSPLLTPLQAAPLLAGSEFIPFSDQSISISIGGGDNSTIGQDSVVHIPTESSSFLFSIPEVSTDHGSFHSITVPDVSSLKISFIQKSHAEIGSFQVGISENSPPQVGTEEKGSSKISSFEIDFFKTNLFQIDSTQVNFTKISLPSSISTQQFLNSNSLSFDLHFSTPLLSNIYSTVYTKWNNLLNLNNPFNITFQIADLPAGQLAEAQITSFDPQDRPNSGTILIDDDANGIGWFIDTTPWENSEFAQTLTDTAFRATTGDAFGKYDLLTTILHETGHLLGIINGNPGFDSNVQTLNGKKVFVGKDFTANLSPDGSHLDTAVHPYDLMNNTLAPGVRKLPSLINLEIINAIRGINTAIPQRPTNPSPQPLFLPVTSTNWKSTSYQPITPSTSTSLAPLRAILLADITNGNFEETDTTKPEFGWSTRGAANILNSQAVLTEDSPFNSNFTQTFIIPEHAKYLQFTILDTHLGTNEFAPNDAFEVALLDARTLTPLVGTAIGLTQTDSLLNLQQTGNTYFSDQVKIVGANTSGDKIALNTPRTVKIDISNIAPGTLATLYFDLLGFGAKDGKVIVDNVMLLDLDLISPTAIADTATTNQAKPVLINILANDSDADGTINPSTVQIGTAPHTGSIIINSDGTLTYTPNNTFVGIDTFTYIVLDNDNGISNEATVTVNINNIAPIIDRITVESNIREGTIATFSAIASDPGDNLTYTWNFGDDSNPVTGQTLNHTFADNGTYTAILTVTDTHGASTVETLLFNVINVAPIVNPGADITTDEGTAITFNGSFIDPGILDTHTITWDFGDGSATTSILNPTHTYTKDGIYTPTLTVTDKDGGTNSNSLTVTVNNTDPIITNISGDTSINEGAVANFSAIATDSGLDTLTYTWNFGDDSNPVVGQNVN